MFMAERTVRMAQFNRVLVIASHCRDWSGMHGKRDISSREIAEIAHELRSPLGGIEAMTEMLEASRLDADQRRMIEALKASVAHLRGIADGVLGVESATTAGAGNSGQAGDGHSQALGTLLAQMEIACIARARAKGLAFSLKGTSEAIRDAVVVAGPLRQVLENLVDNAFRLTPSGVIELEVARKPGGRIGFAVHDSGPGIEAEEAARLIRSGGSIEGRAGGAGIGLSIVGRLVVEHGGTLTGGPAAEGTGAVFAFDWPDQRIGEKGACLIVDDHPASRLVLGTILRSAGYTCLEAANVEEAMRLIEARRPGFVLTDLNMPGAGGSELIRQIAGMPEGQRPKLAVVSADELDADDPLHPLVDGAIRKPITVRSVLETMAQLTQDDSAQESAVCAA